jgi:hypothetical protein
MRFGFVAASLTAHASVVLLAWRFAPEGPAPSRAPDAPNSSLASDELEVTPWEPQQIQEEPPESVEKREEVIPPKSAASKAPATRSEREPKTPTNATPAAPRDADALTAARKTSPTKEADTSSDWLSIDQQLPVDGETKPAPTVPSPKRDLLVERLMAKERDRARLAARDEAARQKSPSAVSEQPPPPSNNRGARASETDNFGENGARADLWVELTRWLPRAASSDPTWETLAAGSSYEFRVELITENGNVVSTQVLDRAPEPTKKLLNNTSHLMSRGRYGGTRRTTHRFELRIRLSTTEGRDLWIAHTTPDPPKPGVGSFISPSGRRFDVWVSQLP